MQQAQVQASIANQSNAHVTPALGISHLEVLLANVSSNVSSGARFFSGIPTLLCTALHAFNF